MLSLPPNLVDYFHEIENVDTKEWFCTSDPEGVKVGSGGGTAWLLEACWRERTGGKVDFQDWLAGDKRILLHAGGQSRRLPGYATSGKILTPIPVFRWERGQKLKQNLLSLQTPLYERIMHKAPDSLHTLIASGDVYIRSDKPLQNIPEADVVCYGLWVNPNQAKNHGVFVSACENPEQLDYMLQKPSLEELNRLMQTHYFLMDIGIWLLSDRAVQLLIERSKRTGSLGFYDLYSEFGLALGNSPRIKDDALNGLSVAILPLPGGEFYHYGTSRELISSTVAVQNLVNDQRAIIHKRIKPHPAMFVQNAKVDYRLTEKNAEVWIENSCVGKDWKLENRHIITGVPENDWQLSLPSEVCADIAPVGEEAYAVRPYGYNDAMKGALGESSTLFMGRPAKNWFLERGLDFTAVEGNEDIQSARIFPLCHSQEEMGVLLRWMISEPQLAEGKMRWENAEKLSADGISARANLRRLQLQREHFRAMNWPALAENFGKSVFYQLDLGDAAEEFIGFNLPLPAPIPEDTPLMTRIHDSMFRSQVQRLRGEDHSREEARVFSLLREGLTEMVRSGKQRPVLDAFPDQIVWGRSPVRIDLAGGWTDTPPYCLNAGGNVLNIAIELNAQPPLHVYVKRSNEYKIILRSIDLGAIETVSTYEELQDFVKVGSPFSIPKAALALAGFCPDFQAERFPSLEAQLKAFGAGIEITLLAAIPAGSGLGTSSVLAATVLGAVSDFCGLGWDKTGICRRTLVLEQLLTIGGGWQDQYGGVLHGVKLLQTQSGFDQTPLVKWLPEHLFTHAEYQKCHLLYYTGITRTAKGILAAIVRNMFLNSTEQLTILAEMKTHALDLYEVIQHGNFPEMGRLIGKTWEQNKRIDRGTNPPEVEAIIHRVKDYCLGYKLPGAGGGGYLYMVAKDPGAASMIRHILAQNPPNDKARFVEMSLSDKGLQVSRS